MKFKANFVEKPVNFQMDDCQIEKVVELPHEDFCRLKITPLADQPFLAENREYMFHKDGIIHCLLALDQDSNDGVLIDAERYNYPRIAAYVPGMRDIVNAEMDRAADFIVRQATENTTSGSWCVYFEELEERLGLTVREGSGWDSMLRLALKRRPEVAAVDMHDGCIETEYHLEYCQQINEARSALMETEQAMGPAMGEDAHMTVKHDAAPLFSHRMMSLIATYEDLYHVPAEEQVTYYFGDLGGHFLKYGVTEDAAFAAYDKALAAIRMDSDTFQQTKEFTYRGGIIARMWSCMLDENASLKDAISCWVEDRNTVLLHVDAPDCCVPMEHLTRLTQAGREDFAALLDAQVEEIRAGDSAIEVVISGVEPQELERFCEAHDTFMETEQAMGPVMG